MLPPCRVELDEAGAIRTLDPLGSPEGADVIVAEGDGWLLPGLIELHLHGAGGVDLTADPDPAAAIASVARSLVRHGVTAFCPTLVSSSPGAILEHLGHFSPRQHPGGAESLGTHLEGPFLNLHYRGVQDPAYLRPPDPEEAARWLRDAPPALVALAPELPRATEVIHLLADAGVLVSLGHSGASLHEARQGLAAGARHGTHLFNAMPPLRHREPGLVGALLTHDDATIELIADGAHLDPAIVDLVVRAAGVERVVLVSDALAAAGLPVGSTVALGQQEVTSDGTVARRADGTLAGAVILADQCLRNAAGWLAGRLPLASVVRMVTETPARALGPAVAGRKGRIAVGYDGDFAVIDAHLAVRTTVVRGDVVYRA